MVDPVLSQMVGLGVGYTVVVHVDLEGSEVDTAVWVDPESLDGHVIVDGYTVFDGGAG